MEEDRFNKEALDWWPFLETIVRSVNQAAISRNRGLLNYIFIEAMNGLGMRIERQEIRQAEVLTVADLKERFRQAIEQYKVEVANVITKRKRLKDPTGGKNPLKPTTVKQYQSLLKCWPENRDMYKKEIKKLSTQIKSLKSSYALKSLKLKNGMTLTVYRGGRYQINNSETETKEGKE